MRRHRPRRRSDAHPRPRPRRASLQARADRVVNEWLQREREESRARGKAVYTTVTLFLSTFIVALMKPSFFELDAGVESRAADRVRRKCLASCAQPARALRALHLPAGRLSVTRPANVTKPFKRSIAWGFVLGGYLFSLTVGMLLSVLTDDLSKQLFGPTSSAESLLGVFFYPPIVVLIVDMIYRVNLHLDDL